MITAASKGEDPCSNEKVSRERDLIKIRENYFSGNRRGEKSRGLARR